MTKGLDTRGRMLAVAAEVFHARGIRGSSVDEVLSASGTGKGQMYHYFRSKDDMIHAVLLEREKAFLPEGFMARPLQSWDDLGTWLRGHLEAQRQARFLRSCPLGSIAGAFDEEQETIRRDLVRIFERMRQPLIGLFERLQARAELDARLDPRALATFCIAAIQGGMLLARAERKAASVKQVIETTLGALRALAPTPGHRRKERPRVH